MLFVFVFVFFFFWWRPEDTDMPDRLIVHIHIHKCAGSTIAKVLGQRYRGFAPRSNNNVNDMHRRGNWPRTKDDMDAFAEQTKRVCDVVAFEYGMPFLEKGSALYSSLCAFRDPVSRAVSQYNYEGWKPKGDVVSMHREHIAHMNAYPFSTNPMSRMLLHVTRPVTEADLPALMEIVDAMDYIYVIDDPHWLRDLGRDFSIDTKDAVRENPSKPRFQLTDAVARRIRELNAIDCMLYDHVKNLVQARLRGPSTDGETAPARAPDPGPSPVADGGPAPATDQGPAPVPRPTRAKLVVDLWDEPGTKKNWKKKK